MSEALEVERGEWFEYEGESFWWKACTEPFCQNFICRNFSEDFCYVHMPQEARDRKEAFHATYEPPP